jgi:hypothetical protein
MLPHPNLQSASPQKMTSNLLQIASRVEAAVTAYNSVHEFSDRKVWKEKFQMEFVSVHVTPTFDHSTFQTGRSKSQISKIRQDAIIRSPSPTPHFGGTIHGPPS